MLVVLGDDPALDADNLPGARKRVFARNRLAGERGGGGGGVRAVALAAVRAAVQERPARLPQLLHERVGHSLDLALAADAGPGARRGLHLADAFVEPVARLLRRLARREGGIRRERRRAPCARVARVVRSLRRVHGAARARPVAEPAEHAMEWSSSRSEEGTCATALTTPATDPGSCSSATFRSADLGFEKEGTAWNTRPSREPRLEEKRLEPIAETARANLPARHAATTREFPAHGETFGETFAAVARSASSARAANGMVRQMPLEGVGTANRTPRGPRLRVFFVGDRGEWSVW